MTVVYALNCIPYDEYPNCLHVTAASFKSHVLSQSVVHVLSTHSSMRPTQSIDEPLSLTSLSVQGSAYYYFIYSLNQLSLT